MEIRFRPFTSSCSSAINVDLDGRWHVYLGAFQATVDSSIAINGRLLPPVPPVDVEDVFEPPLQIGDTILESGTDVYRLTYELSLRPCRISVSLTPICSHPSGH
jgi:hypothetical protein